jgi:23S rRNA (guanosine2251-2'-O)-methyltransferase
MRDEHGLEILLAKLDAPAFLLVLDGVQDPHNLGACLRTADATGVHAVIAPRDRASGLNATARKVSSGAAETVPFVRVTNLARTLRMLAGRGILCAGTDSEGSTDLFEADLSGPLALVMGSEGKGLRRLTREHCDLLLRLPMTGHIASLNVSVAAGVCLYFALASRHRSP